LKPVAIFLPLVIVAFTKADKVVGR